MFPSRGHWGSIWNRFAVMGENYAKGVSKKCPDRVKDAIGAIKEEKRQ